MKDIDAHLIMFQIALKRGIINSQEIKFWAGNCIMQLQFEQIADFIFDLSMAKTSEQVKNIIDDEIWKRKLSSKKISGSLLFPYLLEYDFSLEDNYLFVVDSLLELMHETVFSEIQEKQIYYVDEYRDEYLEGIVTYEKAKEELILFLESHI